MSERRGRLERRFEAVIIDWDETAICDRPADASRLRALVEELCALGMEIAVVSGKSLEDVNGSLLSRVGGRPRGPPDRHSHRLARGAHRRGRGLGRGVLSRLDRG